jgi:carbon storage regulator
MLVLTRKRGESIVLNGEIRVAVLAVGRSSVRLGIEAPSGVTIVREELLLLDDEEREGRAAWDDEELPVAAQKT